jgi:hypothetical protein
MTFILRDVLQEADPKIGHYRIHFKNLQLDVADFDGSVILPVATLNLVLIGLLVLQNGELLGASLFYNLAGNGGL